MIQDNFVKQIYDIEAVKDFLNGTQRKIKSQTKEMMNSITSKIKGFSFMKEMNRQMTDVKSWQCPKQQKINSQNIHTRSDN